MSEFKGHLRYLRVAPRKVKLVADRVRGLPVQEAIDLLAFTKKSAASEVSKLIRSLVTAGSQKPHVDVDNLMVKSIWVNQGPTLRRFLARARGSASRINKKTSHITVVLEER